MRSSPSPSPSYDVIVVGARAAGAATAMLLADSGMKVLLVDRGSYGLDTLSTHALMRAGVIQLHRWGLLDEIIAKGTPAVRSASFTYGGDRIVIPVKPSGGVDALYAPRRTVLDPLLVDAASRAGAEVRYGVTVTGVQRDFRGRVTGIVGRDARGHGLTIDAGLVVGADGARSTIAARVGAPVVRAGTHQSAFVYGYWRDIETDGYEWTFTTRGATGVIPTNDGEACVFAGAGPAEVGRGGREAFDRLLLAASPSLADRLAAGTPPIGVRTFLGRPGLIRRPWGPGWALVGDAGYWKDPVSAHGLTDAFRDAELLARAVITARDGCEPLDAALRGYQEARDRLSFPFFDATDALAAFTWTDDEVGALLLEVSATMNDEIAAVIALDNVAVGC